jgi:stage V sporulation protein D (sporulation-specific penicillin-binding protein)
MKQVLQTVVDQTPDANAYIAGYKIGGKTGTAQKNDEYTDENMRYVASYCCFAPADDPEIIMLIMADEPDNSIAYYGAQVVVPTAKNIMGDILPYLGFYPEYSGSDYSSLTENIPDLNGLMVDQAEDALSELNISYIVSGSGDVVTGQSPQGGISMLTGGTVIIYTSDIIDPETVTVPDLTGKTVSAAKTELYEIGLNLYISRPGDDETNLIVTSQSIEAGTEVDKGSVIMLSIGLSDGDGEYDDYYEDEEVQHEVYLD